MGEAEKKIANTLDLSDISVICASLDFFDERNAIIRQTALDLRDPFRFRVFDWLATNLDRSINEKEEVDDEANVWVAFAQVYLNTTSPEQFVEALRFMDLQLWEGQFTSEEFARDIRQWNDADLKWKSSNDYKALQRENAP